ncbi:MAG: peptide chain release factor N(5)-glutamine methyltransferase, partial [Kaistella sp.]|nr:peptide chain release factor N(5)-glutamine methyltransferase [Kaistella sp.]
QNYLQENLSEVYDVIISNPPYIGKDEEIEIADSVKEFEPKMALFSPTSNALIFYEKIADDCKNHLAENGMVFLEINQKLGEETKALFTDVLSEVYLVKDISGNDRFVWGKK